MGTLSSRTRVIAITRDDAPINLRPHYEARLRAGDTVYLVGPYRELVATLRKGLPPKKPEQPPRAGQQVDGDGVREVKAG
jgi:NhaP-type Na+/H+ and K+/H+ antiporter